MFQTEGPRLRYGNVTVIPSIHGRAAFALEVRRQFLSEHYDCIAVELPPSVQDAVCEAVEKLPSVHVVLYREPESREICYIPMDPCDSIVEAVRLGVRDRRCHLAFVDAEVAQFHAQKRTLPDEYAVLKIGLPKYYETVAPFLPETQAGSQDELREKVMAVRLKALSKRHKNVLFVCGMAHARAIGQLLATDFEAPEDGDNPNYVEFHKVDDDSLYHILGELPYNTWLYEQIRHSITLEEYEPIFSLKTLLLTARERYHDYYRDEIHKIAPQAVQQMLIYIRNLCLIGGQLTPYLYDIAVAAKGIGGDAFAVQLLEVARTYGELPPVVPPGQVAKDPAEAENAPERPAERPAEKPPEKPETPPEDEPEERHPWESTEPWLPDMYQPEPLTDYVSEDGFDNRDIKMTQNSGLYRGKVEVFKTRLPGVPKVMKPLKLEKPPPPKMKKQWKQAWDDRRAVSWPPEDEIVEGFADYVRKRALKLTQLSMQRSEEFRCSLMDGLHIKETLRNVHLGKLYVKVEPRATGNVGAVVVIFEEDKEDGRFPWKITWYAEHDNESTLAFYATPYQENLVGPGVARSLYGGALFLYPPKSIPNVWENPRLGKARTSMERLVFGAAVHSDEKYIAYVSPTRPTIRMKQFCELYGRKLIYLPLSSFSRGTLWKMRTFHVLNGRHVRSWASRYIR